MGVADQSREPISRWDAAKVTLVASFVVFMAAVSGAIVGQLIVSSEGALPSAYADHVYNNPMTCNADTVGMTANGTCRWACAERDDLPPSNRYLWHMTSAYAEPR